jgi:hypothetical protein
VHGIPLFSELGDSKLKCFKAISGPFPRAPSQGDEIEGLRVAEQAAEARGFCFFQKGCRIWDNAFHSDKNFIPGKRAQLKNHYTA